MTAKNALIVFAKPPVAGLAKTRLIPALGEDGAAAYHKKLLHHTLENVIFEDKWDTHLWCSENTKHDFFQFCEKEFSLVLRQQINGDLGSKMAYAIEQMLKGYEKVCIIGSDCPLINVQKLQNVFNQLKKNDDVVITPAEDGGYVQLAVKRQLNPEIFAGISWGGAGVFQATLNNINRLGLNPVIQPTLWDVDEPEDLIRFSAL